MNKENIKQHCQALTKSGVQCRAKAQYGSAFCFFHDPERATERHAAKVKGGHSRAMKTLPKGTAAFEVSTANDIVSLLSQTINQVRSGELDPRIANSVGYLAGIVLKAREQGELDERLKLVEEAIAKGTNNGSKPH